MTSLALIVMLAAAADAPSPVVRVLNFENSAGAAMAKSVEKR